MKLLDTLTRAADEEQLRLQPLPEHAAAAQAEHLRQHYALLLAAVLTAQPAVSEPQTRLLRLLLDALKLGDIRGPLFEQARELEPEPLLEAARLIREAGFAQHLMLDVLVLLRLDAPLGDEATRLAGELAAFLGLEKTDLSTRAEDVSEILGLNTNENDRSVSGAGKEGDGDNSAEDIAAEHQPLLAELWPSQLPQLLTVEALRGGLHGGLWLLDADLKVDFPWQANDAVLHFRNGSMLTTFVNQGEVKLTDCRLVDAVLDFLDAGRITLERCNWRGDYDLAAERTALHSTGPALTITDCQFSTRNAQAIMVQGNALTLTRSRFTRCGHPKMYGGAIYHSNHTRTIVNCHFDRCIATRGGALLVADLFGVEQCEFVSCESRAWQGKQGGDIAVFADENSHQRVLVQCVFRHTSVNVGSSRDRASRSIGVNCQFIHGNLYSDRNDGHILGAGSTFDGGSVIERRF